MKPQFKPEEIYLDLSKLSEEQQRKVIALLPEPINKDDYDISFLHFYLIYDDEDCIWWVSTKYFLAEKTELTYSQFLDMMGESEEVLQVENNGWIKILSETDLPKEVDQYWFASHNNKIEIRFYNPNWINDRVQFRHRYTHYQPIVKPLPPKF